MTTVAPTSLRSPALRAAAACWIHFRWAVERLTGPLQEINSAQTLHAVPRQEITVSDEDIAWAQVNAQEWQVPRHRQALVHEAGAPHV